jgi:hypothetical protein
VPLEVEEGVMGEGGRLGARGVRGREGSELSPLGVEGLEHSVRDSRRQQSKYKDKQVNESFWCLLLLRCLFSYHSQLFLPKAPPLPAPPFPPRNVPLKNTLSRRGEVGGERPWEEVANGIVFGREETTTCTRIFLERWIQAR